MNNKTVFDLQQEGAPIDLVVVLKSKWNPQYDAAREISNSKFDYKPSGIAYCKNVNHVQHCINFCRENNIPFRVRSGGHQHEGMSSGDDVLVIALSEMYEIEYTKDKDGQFGDEAWIPVGKELGDVYEELETRNQIIPGGGCQSVNVGGLTHGGGLGVSIRKYGMTCDDVMEAEIVLADGQIVYPSTTNHPDLFWGLKGGGGGNFGIVTRFKFKLRTLVSEKQPEATIFHYGWKDPKDTLEVIDCWLKMQTDVALDRNISASCTMLVSPPTIDEKECSVTIRMGGLFYGQRSILEDILAAYFPAFLLSNDKVEATFVEKIYQPKTDKKLYAIEDTLKNTEKPEVSFVAAQAYLADFLSPLAPATSSLLRSANNSEDKELPIPPAATCDAPYPHKVTSAFPKVGINHFELAKKIYDYLAQVSYLPDVNKYMSFYCLGGAVYDNPAQRAFPWSDRPYLLQVEACWNLSGNVKEDAERAKKYDAWVHDFREAIKSDIEGAFINFVDQHLVENPNTAEGKLELLKFYYGDNLPKLRQVKTQYDKAELFEFAMSIPPIA